MPTVLTTVLQSSSGQKCKLQVYSSYTLSSTVGVSDVLGGMVDANGPLLMRVGVGLLTAGGGPLGGVSCNGASDMVVASRLTPGSGLLAVVLSEGVAHR